VASQDERFMRSALEQMLGKFRGGAPELALFTTFTFSSSFFETNVLPLIAGFSLTDVKEKRISRDALNLALRPIRIAVACDRSASPDPKGGVRYGLLPVGLRRGRFHPKMILMAGELAAGGRGVWLAVGSGNLTLSGWGRNREVIGVTELTAKDASELMPLLKWLLGEAEQRVSAAKTQTYPDHAPAVEEGETREVLKELIDAVARNTLTDRGRTKGPTLHLALPAEVAGDAQPLLKKLTGAVKWDSLTVVSPYWSHVPELVQELQVKTCRLVPSVGHDGLHYFPLDSLNANKKVKKQCSFLRFPDDLFTHAKALLFEKDGKWSLCTGSANFTRAALSPEEGTLANVEAMLRYPVAGTPWKGLHKSLDEENIGQPTEDEEKEGAPPLPPFDAEVLCDWKKGVFICRVTIHRGASLASAKLEVAGIGWPLRLTEETGQQRQIAFQATQPVRVFFLSYRVKGRSEGTRFRGLITQFGAEDDDLGFRSRPRLSSLLDQLRALDPSQPVPRGPREEGDGDGSDYPAVEASFDFFAFMQAIYKLRRHYETRPGSDPFSEGDTWLSSLRRAIMLQPAATAEGRVAQYVQLCELLELVRWAGRRDGRETDPAKRLREDLERQIAKLEKEMLTLVRKSQTFRELFGADTRTRGRAFIDWFRAELREAGHAAG
jgi:hypothetical protein